jgi:hypothetical protein
MNMRLIRIDGRNKRTGSMCGVVDQICVERRRCVNVPMSDWWCFCPLPLTMAPNACWLDGIGVWCLLA